VVVADRGDVDVVFAVVVIVADSAAHAVRLHCQARLPGAIGEGSVSVVVVEGGVVFRGAVPWPVHRVHKQDVLETIVVVIQNAYTAPHGFGEVFLAKGTAMVTKGNAGGRGGVDKTDGTGRALR